MKKILLICVLMAIIPVIAIPVVDILRHRIRANAAQARIPLHELRPTINMGFVFQITINTDGNFDYDTSITPIGMEDFYTAMLSAAGDILSRPANEITPEQYDILTQIFIAIYDDVSAIELFLNYLATPIEIPYEAGDIRVHSKRLFDINITNFRVLNSKSSDKHRNKSKDGHLKRVV